MSEQQPLQEEVAESSPAPQPPRFILRRRFLIVLLLVSIPMAVMVGYRARRVYRQKAAIARLESLGAVYKYEFEVPIRTEPEVPQWLRNLLSDDFFYPIVHVDVSGTKVSDDDVRLLTSALPELRWMFLEDCRISDSAVVHIESLDGLNWLNVGKTDISKERLTQFRQNKPKTQFISIMFPQARAETALER